MQKTTGGYLGFCCCLRFPKLLAWYLGVGYGVSLGSPHCFPKNAPGANGCGLKMFEGCLCHNSCFWFTLQPLSDHLRCVHVSKSRQNSPVMFPIHRATAVVLRFALQVALDQKATEVTGSWMPVGEKSTLGLGSHTATQRLQPSDWPSHKHQNRSRRCKVSKSRFFKNKSRRPGFLGSILSWSVGEK